MIVPMKKAAVITQFKDAGHAIKTLGSLGVLHVEHQTPPLGADIASLRDEIALAEKAAGILSGPEFSKKTPIENERHVKDWKAAASHVVESYKRLDHLEEYSRHLRNGIKDWERWGDFDPEAVNRLAAKGIYLRLYEIPVRGINGIPPGLIVKKVFSAGGIVGCAVISREKADLPFKELELPKASLKDMRARLKEDTQTIQSVKNNIVRHLCYQETFARIKKALEDELELHEALGGMGQAGGLAYLTGYVPHDTVKRLSETAKKEKWGLLVRDPSGEDNVPTLIRNPKWISIIEPVFRAIEVVPGYRELDISLWFLLFLSAFFGMLIGDAGYGAVYFLLVSAAGKKWGKNIKIKPALTLFKILSLSSVAWGALTGTFFGQEWLPGVVKPLIPALRNDKSIQTLCFFLGTLHLSIAHIWRVLKKLPSIIALADIGWTAILCGGFFLAKTLILGEGFPSFGKWFFMLGACLVVFFTNPPGKNALKGFGGGLGALLLNFVNSFTDIVSYIRLFAVGLAGVAIADAFNNMAMSVGYGSFVKGAAASLILVLGHALNMMLGPLAVLVHGVRLNVLEFCNHLDIKWSGFSYKPLRKKEEDLYGRERFSSI